MKMESESKIILFDYLYYFQGTCPMPDLIQHVVQSSPDDLKFHTLPGGRILRMPGSPEFIQMLLLKAGIESNPGPRSPTEGDTNEGFSRAGQDISGT